MKRIVFLLIFCCMAAGLFAQTSNRLVMQGNDAYRKGDFNKAVEAYKNALREDPSNNAARFNLANALQRQKEIKESQKLYDEVIARYTEKKKGLQTQTWPIISDIRRQQGNHIENVVVPFTDGKKSMQVLTNLDKYLANEGREIGLALERNIALAMIDDAWKEHLRAMDDLRQSVQTAGYEQKDPLVIYKIEDFNAFKQMDDQVNKDIVSFLSHAQIPIEQRSPAKIREGHEQKTDMSKMASNKMEVDAAGSDYGANENDYYDPSGPVKQEPVRVEPKIGRNDLCPCGSGKKYKHCHGR